MRWFEEVQLGESYDLGSVTMKEEDMEAFASAYNRSWLHTDREAMKDSKYKDIIAPGMFTFSAGWAPFIDLDIFERAEIGGTKTEVEWFKAVYAGDILTSKAIIVHKEDWSSSLGKVTVDIETYKQTGKLAVRSSNEILVRKRAAENQPVNGGRNR